MVQHSADEGNPPSPLPCEEVLDARRSGQHIQQGGAPRAPVSYYWSPDDDADEPAEDDEGPVVEADILRDFDLTREQLLWLRRQTYHVALNGKPAWQSLEHVGDLLDLYHREQGGSR